MRSIRGTMALQVYFVISPSKEELYVYNSYDSVFFVLVVKIIARNRNQSKELDVQQDLHVMIRAKRIDRTNHFDSYRSKKKMSECHLAESL